MSAIVALTAQNTREVASVHEVPPWFVRAQLDAVAGDIGIDAAKTGMLFSRPIIETVADWLEEHPLPLVVDPVMVASSGARLLEEDAVEVLVRRLFPLATVVTPNVMEAHVLTGSDAAPAELAEALVELGAPAAVVTGGHGEEPADHLFDGREHLLIPFERRDVTATHGAGCTHSATLAALLARGLSLAESARGAAAAASRAVTQGLAEIGGGDGPVDVLGVAAR
jgi:hydroxymethylpyrimidine/phosphomethylpyrimidine kinase